MTVDLVVIMYIFGLAVGLVALYAVIRLAVTHAIRSSALWRADRRYDMELARRRGEV